MQHATGFFVERRRYLMVSRLTCGFPSRLLASLNVLWDVIIIALCIAKFCRHELLSSIGFALFCHCRMPGVSPGLLLLSSAWEGYCWKTRQSPFNDKLIVSLLSRADCSPEDCKNKNKELNKVLAQKGPKVFFFSDEKVGLGAASTRSTKWTCLHTFTLHVALRMSPKHVYPICSTVHASQTL